MFYTPAVCATTRNRSDRDLDRIFDDFFNPGSLVCRPSSVTPVIDIWEDETSYHVEAELPGFGIEDLDVEVVGNELFLKGKKETSEEDKSGTYHRRERRLSQFSKVVSLPGDVDAEKIDAKLEHGVLGVVLPKAASSRARKIAVKN